MLGRAALAMWWDIEPDVRDEFEHWHAHEHFPERLALPGFLRASRWRESDEGKGVFVLYELADYDVLSSAGYIARLNAPSVWSVRLMPHHLRMIRSQCRVVTSHGGITSNFAVTIRFSPRDGQERAVHAAVERIARSAWMEAGLFGVHLLAHEAPSIAATTEQRIRGLSDSAADWILLACGYNEASLHAFCHRLLADSLLSAAMERPSSDAICRLKLAISATPGDVVAGLPHSFSADARPF